MGQVANDKGGVSNNTTCIACASDSRFFVPLCVMLYSALVNLRPDWSLSITLIDGGLSAAQRATIRRVCDGTKRDYKILWIEPKYDLLPKLHACQKLQVQAYLRLLVPLSVPDYLVKIIWLDSDIVVAGDLAELQELPLNGKVIAAVRDYGGETVATVAGTAATFEKMGVDPSTPYFNSGVMVIDVRMWRKRAITDQVFSYTKRFINELRYADQDGLNMVIKGEWSHLHPSWNVQVAVLRRFDWLKRNNMVGWIESSRDELAQAAKIIHFTTNKPWNSGLRSPFRKTYFEYLERSCALTRFNLMVYRFRCVVRSICRYFAQDLKARKQKLFNS